MTEDSNYEAEDRYYETEDGLVDRHTAEVINLNEIIDAKSKAYRKGFAELRKEASILGVPVPFTLKLIRNVDYKIVQIKEGYLFNKMFRIDLQAFFKNSDLDVYSLAFIARFTPFIVYPQNYLVINGSFPTEKELSPLLKIKPRKLSSVLRELEYYEVIRRKKDGTKNVIYFNPFLFCSGVVIDLDTYNLFADSIFNPRNNL